MVQFLSINFFSWISSIFVGFFKSSRFFVSLCSLRYSANCIFHLVVAVYCWASCHYENCTSQCLCTVKPVNEPSIASQQ